MTRKPRPPLERAARALCAAQGNPEDAAFEGKPMWHSYSAEAEAVLDALQTGPLVDILLAAARNKGVPHEVRGALLKAVEAFEGRTSGEKPKP